MPRGDEESPGRPTHLPTRNLPEDWLGIYTTLEEVPDRYRLRNFETQLAGENPFEDYLDSLDDISERSRERKYRKAYRDFTGFMEEQGTHPACPTPDQVERFFVRARDGDWSNVSERSWSTLYATYLSPLKMAFKWIVHHVDYPHVYNPLLMAAAQEGVTRDIWIWKTTESEERWERRKQGKKPRETNNE